MVSVLWTNCRRQRWFRHALQLRRLLSLSASPPYLNLTQEDLVKLPLARFTGDCILISTPQDEEKYASAIDSLFSNAVLGFDTEWHCWRPRRAPSLVQLASEDVCIMWRLCYRDQEKWFVGADFPPKLFNLLNTHRIIKVGHSSNNDAYLILKHYYVNSCSVFNTHPLSRELGLPMESLRGLAGMMLGVQVTKKQAKTNWESRWLSDMQLQYASTDAWVSLKVYEALMKYATVQGVLPGPPAKTAFQFVPTDKERRHLEKMVHKARFQRRTAELEHSITVKKTLMKEPQYSTATQETVEAETRKHLGILERIREVINHFLLNIEAAEQSTPPSSPSPFSGTSENSRGCDNLSEIDISCQRRPVASVTHGSHTEQGWSTSHEKISVVEPCKVDGNGTEPSCHLGEASMNMKEDSRDRITVTATEDGVAYNKSNSMTEWSKCDSKCTDRVEGAASLSSLEVNSSNAECYGSKPRPQVVTDDDVLSTNSEIESSDQAGLARNLVLS